MSAQNGATTQLMSVCVCMFIFLLGNRYMGLATYSTLFGLRYRLLLVYPLRTQVRKIKQEFCSTFCFKTSRAFYQDRLGTDIEKPIKSNTPLSHADSR